MPVDNDGLPTHICQDCLCELNQAYKFVLKCQKSDDKLRNHLNRNINTSAVVQICSRNYGITQTDGICVKTEEVANINSSNVIQNANDLNANVKLEADLTLGISDLSMKQENAKILEGGRCSGEDFKSPSLNDSFDFNISLREPLPTSVIQNDLDRELDVIKHEIDCDVKTEMQRYINRNEDIDVNRASVNLHENITEPKLCRQSSKLQSEKETKTKISSVHTKAKNDLSSCVNSIEFKKSHINSFNTDEITSNQPKIARNMMNAVVILEDINVHLKSLRSPIQQQFEQSSTHHKIGQIRQSFKINDQYCTKMPVKRKIKCRAINTTEETSKSTISRLRRHQVHIPYTCKFTCTVCEKSFNNKRAVRCHTMKHTRKSLYPPDGIVKSITRNEGGTRHVLKHISKKSFVCKICEKIFTEKTRLNLHLLTHTGEKPYSCATCGKTFDVRELLNRHMLIHIGEEFYSCTTCDETFNQRRSLIAHKLKHTGKKRYSCATCDKTFTRKGTLIAHKFQHTGEKPYSCAICDKTFIQRRGLIAHKWTHTGEKPYSCATCDKAFTRRGTLIAHKLTHTGEKPYSCVICNKTFTQRRSLNGHKWIHTGEKPYSCATCDKTFTQRESLIAHTMTHTGEKPYSCVTCDKTFTRERSLIAHKLTHSEEKPFQCVVCDKTFIQRRSLIAHKLTHTGEKPYSCATCDKTFIRKEYLTRHMLTHIGKKMIRENV